MTQCIPIKCLHYVHSIIAFLVYLNMFVFQDRNFIISLWIYRPLIVDVNKSCIFQVQRASFSPNWAYVYLVDVV